MKTGLELLRTLYEGEPSDIHEWGREDFHNYATMVLLPRETLIHLVEGHGLVEEYGGLPPRLEVGPPAGQTEASFTATLTLETEPGTADVTVGSKWQFIDALGEVRAILNANFAHLSPEIESEEI